MDAATRRNLEITETLRGEPAPTLLSLLDACAKDKACAAREPQLAERWRSLLASLPRKVSLTHPAIGSTETVEMTREMVLAMARGPLYLPLFAAALPAAR